MAQYEKVQVYHQGEFVGTFSQYYFRTNGGTPAIQNGSVAAFCPHCGEVWLRLVHSNPDFPYWREEVVPCIKHAATPGAHSFRWGKPEHLFQPPTPDTDYGVLLLEFLWWCRYYPNFN